MVNLLHALLVHIDSCLKFYLRAMGMAALCSSLGSLRMGLCKKYCDSHMEDRLV